MWSTLASLPRHLAEWRRAQERSGWPTEGIQDTKYFINPWYRVPEFLASDFSFPGLFYSLLKEGSILVFLSVTACE